MKKILAALLATTLVFGMSATVFAAETRFYLANRELQLEDNVEPYEQAPEVNANANPGTGR